MRGVDACANAVAFPMALVDEAVLGSLRDLLTPRLVPHVLAQLRALLEPAQVDTQHDRLAADLATVEARIGRLTEAVGAGPLSVPELVAQLQDAQRRRQALTEALTALEVGRDGQGAPDWATVEAEARTKLKDWRRLLGRHPTEARPVLRQLLDGRRIRFTPLEIGAQRGFRFEGDAGVGGVLDGLVARVTSRGVPTGIRTRVSALKGPRPRPLDDGDS